MNKRLFLSPPHMCGREINLINEAFQSNWIAPAGPDIEAFEKEMCALINGQNAVALSSGTAALHLALIVSGVEAGDDVYCSSFTFAGSAFPIVHIGANPVFIDSEKNSWNMDPNLLKDAVEYSIKNNRKPAAVVLVHLYGQSADVKSIKEICDRYEIVLIEDAAESLGAFCGDLHTGTIGDFGIYSFNGNKIITTSGGGMLVGKNKCFVDKARYLSTQAREPFPYYHHVTIGYNYRMSNVCAAIGRGQLTALNERVEKKRQIFNYYSKQFENIESIRLIPNDVYGKSNCWLTCIVFNEKTGFEPEKVRLELEKENIESRPLWKPMHLQPVFSNVKSFVSGVSEDLFNRGLCLPSGTAMSEEDVDRVVKILKAFSSKPKLEAVTT